MRIAFCHPDLGLGGMCCHLSLSKTLVQPCAVMQAWLTCRLAGAERLIVDAASELASRGHTVRLQAVVPLLPAQIC